EGLARHLEHQAAERDEQEPIATERDHRCEEEAPEVAVPPQQGGGGAGTRRALPVSPFRHGLQDYRAFPSRRETACSSPSPGSGKRRSGGETPRRTIYIDPWGTPADAP